MAGGVHGGVVCGRGVFVVGGACMTGGVHGGDMHGSRGHVWQ